MGSKSQLLFLNKSEYKDVSISGDRGSPTVWIAPTETKAIQSSTNVQINVMGSGRRNIQKTVTFPPPSESFWVIRNDGVKEGRHGEEFPAGQLFPFDPVTKKDVNLSATSNNNQHSLRRQVSANSASRRRSLDLVPVTDMNDNHPAIHARLNDDKWETDEGGNIIVPKFCAKVMTKFLRAMHDLTGGNTAVGEDQGQLILQKMCILGSYTEKEVCDMVSFLSSRGRYYDFSILNSELVDRWRSAFLFSEFYGRLTANLAVPHGQLRTGWNFLETFHTSYFHPIAEGLVDILKKYPKSRIADLEFLHTDSPAVLRILKNRRENWFQQLRNAWLLENIGQGHASPSRELSADLDTLWALHDRTPLKNNAALTRKVLLEIGPVSVKECIKFLQYVVEEQCSEQDLQEMIDTTTLNNNMLEDLRSSTTYKKLSTLANHPLHRGDKLLFLHVSKLYKGGFLSYPVIIKMLDQVGKHDAANFRDAIVTISAYDLKDSASSLLESLKTSHNYSDWGELVFRKALSSFCTPESKDKSLPALLSELRQDNIPDAMISDVKTRMENLHRQAKGAITGKDLEIILGRVCHSIQTCFGHYPRDIQIISVLILLLQSEGKLLKIRTGEGKSTTIAILSAMLILMGKHKYVDVVTSSAVLASRDISLFTKFYSSLGISVADAATTPGAAEFEPGTPKKCYSAQIVYGEAGEFQGDILRHEYHLFNTRGERTFGAVVVDEVDSMFIDQTATSVKLVDEIPGREYLSLLFAFIWKNLQSTFITLMKIEGSYYSMRGDTEEVGSQDDLVFALLKSLPPAVMKRFQLSGASGPEDLIEKVAQFAQEMKKEELESVAAREITLEFLSNLEKDCPTGYEALFPITIAQLRKSGFVPDPEYELVDICIKEKWSFDKGNVKQVVQLLQLMLGIRVAVYSRNAASQEIVICPEVYGDEEGAVPFQEYELIFAENLADRDEIPVKLWVDLKTKILYKMEAVPDINSYLESEIVARLNKTVHFGAPSTANEVEIQLQLPLHLETTFLYKNKVWISSAIKVHLEMEENKDYILKQNHQGHAEITPVDYENTGVLQDNTAWGDGIHQFLQIKHKLRISKENLATNFISNVTFFQRYKGGAIYGMTGTLGSSAEVRLLSKLYGVTTLEIPPFRGKRFKELEPLSLGSREDWLTAVSYTVTLECVRRRRAALIICNTIKDAGWVKEAMEQGGSKETLKIQLYDRNDSGDAIHCKELESCTVLIATNLAGRGLDVSVSPEVLANGGLHVCITFLPLNSRVEEQAMGRTARKGQPGTAQLVINAGAFGLHAETFPVQLLRQARDQDNAKVVQEIENRVSKELAIEEKLFIKFCAILKQLRQSEKNRTKLEEIKLNAMGSEWASLLDKMRIREMCGTPESTLLSNQAKVNSEFDLHFKEMAARYNSQEVEMKNPFYLVQMGVEQMLQHDYKQAIIFYSKAIEVEPYFCEQAYYFRAYCLLQQKPAQDNLTPVLNDLVKCKQVIQGTLLPLYQALHLLVDHNGAIPPLSDANPEQTKVGQLYRRGESPNEISSQVVAKMNFYMVQLSSIDTGLEVLRKGSSINATLFSYSDLYKEHNEPEPLAEFPELSQLGATAFIKFDKRPVSWWTVVAVSLLGVTQVVAGAWLAANGFVPFGLALVAEGAGDLWTAWKTAQGDDFTWENWGFQKIISFGISMLFLSLGSVPSAFSAYIFKGMGKLLSSPAGTRVISSSGVQYFLRVGRPCRAFFSTGFNSVGNAVYSIKAAVKQKLAALNRILESCRQHVMQGGRGLMHRVLGENARRTNEALIRKQWLSGLNRDKIRMATSVIKSELTHSALNKVADGFLFSPAGDFIEGVLTQNIQTELTSRLMKDTNSSFSKGLDALFFATAPDKEQDLCRRLNEKALAVLGRIDLTLMEDTGIQIANKFLEASCKSDTTQSGTSGRLLLSVVRTLFTSSPDLVMATGKLRGVLAHFTASLDTIVRDEQEMLYKTSGAKHTRKTLNKNVEKIKSQFIQIWTKGLAKCIRGQIEKHVLKPLGKSGVDHLIGKISKNPEMKEMLKVNAKVLEDITNLKRSTAHAQHQQDQRPQLERTRHPGVHKLAANTQDSSKPGGSELFPAMAAKSGRSIELWKEQSNGRKVYYQTFGHSLDNRPPLCFLYRSGHTNSAVGHWDVLEKGRNGNVTVVDLSRWRTPGSNCMFEAYLHSIGAPINADSVAETRQEMSNYVSNTPLYANLLTKRNAESLSNPADRQRVLLYGGLRSDLDKFVSFAPNSNLGERYQSGRFIDKLKQIRRQLFGLKGKRLNDLLVPEGRNPIQDALRIKQMTGPLDGLFTADFHVHNDSEPTVVQGTRHPDGKKMEAENTFRGDYPSQRERAGTGAVRLLCKPKVHKENVVHVHVLAVVDDHRGQVLKENEVPFSEKGDYLWWHSKQGAHGVRLVNTRSDRFSRDGFHNEYFGMQPNKTNQ